MSAVIPHDETAEEIYFYTFAIKYALACLYRFIYFCIIGYLSICYSVYEIEISMLITKQLRI